MKKIVVLIIALLLACALFSAQAEPAVSTVDELLSFCDSLLEIALRQEPVNAEPEEEGHYRFDYGDFILVSDAETLTADSRIFKAELPGAGEPMADMRGIACGSSLEALLAAYPLDNPDLAGTYDEAVLYISGVQTDTVNDGLLVRSGSQGIQVEHDIFTQDGDGMEMCYVIYLLENNAVASIHVGMGISDISQAEAAEFIGTLAEIQESRDYAVYRDENPEPLAREDLRFGVIDFISAGEAELTAALGPAEADNWEQEEGANLRTLEWEGVTATLEYDAQRQNPVLRQLQIYGGLLEGPRGFHMDDTLESVLARLPQEGEETLYGDGQNAPYGVIAKGEQGIYIQLAIPTEEGSALLTLEFVDNTLWVITCVLQ